MKFKTRITVAGCLGLFTLFMGSQTFAQEIVLDLSVAIGEEEPHETQIEASMGEEAEIEANEGYRLLVVPSLGTNNRIRLSFRLFETASESEEPIASPIVETIMGRKVGVEFGTEPPDANSLRIQVTPTSP